MNSTNDLGKTGGEIFLNLKEARAYLKEKYRQDRCVKTIRNWITRGIGSVKLRGWKVGGRITTSQEAIDEFIQRQTEKSGLVTYSPMQAARETEQAIEELMRDGFCGRKTKTPVEMPYLP